jgi:hypothetical protein
MPLDPPTDHEKRAYHGITTAARTLARESPRLLTPGPAPSRTFGSILGILAAVILVILIRLFQ